MAMQGGTDGFTGALSFLNVPSSEPMRHSRHMAETLLSMGGEAQLESQSRALALAFLERHDEAIVAYEQAIFEMSRLGNEIAGDSLAMLHFKHGCELARAGRNTQALVALEKAIALDSTWAQEARQDDAWELLFSHPRFKDLVGDIDQQRLRHRGLAHDDRRRFAVIGLLPFVSGAVRRADGLKATSSWTRSGSRWSWLRPRLGRGRGTPHPGRA